MLEVGLNETGGLVPKNQLNYYFTQSSDQILVLKNCQTFSKVVAISLQFIFSSIEEDYVG